MEKRPLNGCHSVLYLYHSALETADRNRLDSFLSCTLCEQLSALNVVVGYCQVVPQDTLLKVKGAHKPLKHRWGAFSFS